MSPNSGARGRHNVKRRKIDTTDTIGVAHGAAKSGARRSAADNPNRRRKPSIPPKLSLETNPGIRPPQPFNPNVSTMWVMRDSAGQKQLVSERLPGSRDWRIGDPHMSFCFECRKEGDLVGCYTCKRSYHISCFGASESEVNTPRDKFYCPLCIERGWDLQPPPEILPLTPVLSREGSPAPSRGGAASIPVSCTPNIQSQALQDEHYEQCDDVEYVRNSNSEQRVVGPEPPVPSTGEIHSPQVTSSGQGVSLSTTETPLLDGIAAEVARQPQLRGSPSPSGLHEADAMEKGTTARAKRKRSRYTTMPDEVDQAITTIYRELESVAELRLEIKALQDQIKAVDQTRQILEGRLALERSSREEALSRKDAEIESLNQRLEAITRAHDSLLQENSLLKQRAEEEQSSMQAKLEEMQALKASLRRWLGD